MSKSKASLAGPKIPPGIFRRNFFRTEAIVLTEKLWMFTKRPANKKMSDHDWSKIRKFVFVYSFFFSGDESKIPKIA